MSSGTALSLLINIGVGVYFGHFYPKTLNNSFKGRRLPPFFAFMGRALPPFGWGLVIASLLYGAYLLAV